MSLDKHEKCGKVSPRKYGDVLLDKYKICGHVSLGKYKNYLKVFTEQKLVLCFKAISGNNVYSYKY
jgi:hypothetical protein